RGSPPARARRMAVFLRSRDRKIRELALDALRDCPPAAFKEDLAALLDDPAEELVLRAAELLARAGTADCRRRLLEKAGIAPDRVRRFILGRLSSTGSLDVPGPAPRGGIAPPRYEEYVFPEARPLSLRGGR